MKVKKVGVVYTSFNKLENRNLINFFKLETTKQGIFYTFKVETNNGLNFIVKANTKKINLDFNKKIYFDIFGHTAAALAKFEFHTNLRALSFREYNDIKGGSPYQVFKTTYPLYYVSIILVSHLILSNKKRGFILLIVTT